MIKNTFGKTIASLLTSALIAASFVLGSASVAHASIAPSPEELNTARAQIFNETNAARAANGLAPLVLNSALNSVAQNCSIAQANAFNMFHCTGYASQYPPGYNANGENVAYGYTYQTVTGAWMGSEGHRENILRPQFTDIGIGYYFDDNGVPYFTQNFAGYASTVVPPAAPSNVSATGGNNSVSVSFNAPAYNGNGAITAYQVGYTHPITGLQVATVPANLGPHTVTGLAGGVDYTIQVRAVNSAGTSAWSASTTASVFSKPAVTSVTPVLGSDRDVTIGWDIFNGGSAVTALTLTVDGQNVPVLPTDTSVLVEDLIPGQTYVATLTATNIYGTSDEFLFGWTADAEPPTAPVGLSSSVDVNPRTMMLSWNEPTFDGGSAITGYVINIYDSSSALVDTSFNDPSQTYMTTPVLTLGDSYTFTVTAVNGIGSTDSASHGFTVPFIAPSVPLNLSASLTDEQEITVNWDASLELGHDGVDGFYQVSLFRDGNILRSSSTTGTSWVFNSSNGVNVTNANYTVSVYAFNPANTNLRSSTVTTGEVFVPPTPTVASVPLGLTLDSTTDSVTVEWEAPADNGGTAITGYVITISLSGTQVASETVNASTFEHTFNGLALHTNYDVTVVAVNNRGNSTPASDSVRTLSNPASQVGNLTGTVQPNGSFFISWDEPADNGGDSDLTYEWVITLDGDVHSSGVTSYLFFNTDVLPFNQTGNITITPVNSGGAGGSTVLGLNTVETASAVTVTMVVLDGVNLNIDFTPPTDWGTFDVSGYVVSNGTNSITIPSAVSLTSVSVTAADLGVTSKGTSYPITVQALTGSSIPGTISDPYNYTVPTTVPSAPLNVTATPSAVNGDVTIEWNAPADNGGLSLTYGVNVTNTADLTLAYSVSGLNSLSDVVSGLTPNTSYSVIVTATNLEGSTQSSSVLFTSPPTVPGKATNLHLSIGVVSGTVDTTWDAPTDNGGTAVTSYIVTLSGVSSSYEDTITVDGSTTTATFVAVPYETDIQFTVQAVNSRGTGETSDVSGSLTTPDTPVTLPSDVYNISVTTNDTDTIITWVEPVDVGHSSNMLYDVKVYHIDDLLVPVIDVTDVTSTHITIPHASGSLIMLEDHYAVITAKNEAGSSAAVNGPVFTAGLKAPGAVTNLTVTPGSPSTNVTVTWDNAVGTLPYMADAVVYQVDVLDSNNVSVHSSVETTRSVTLNGLTRGETYTVEVTAQLETFSSAVTTTTHSVPVVVPSQPGVATTVNGLSITALWNVANNGGATITGYTVTLVNTSTTVVVASETLNGTITSFTFNSLEPNVNYTVNVVATNSVGDSPVGSNTATTPVVLPGNVTVLTFDGSLVEWSPVASGGGTVTYAVTVSNDKDSTVVTDVTATESFSYLETLIPGATYTVEVTASNSAGSSVTASTTYVEPAIISTVPLNPELTITGVSSAVATWEAPVNDGGATVEYFVTLFNVTDSTSSVATTATLGANFTGLVLENEYYFTVAAVNSAGTSAEVTSNTVETAPATAVDPLLTEEELQTAINLLAFPQFNVVRTNNQVTVTFTASDEWLYAVAYSTPVGLGWGWAGTGTLTFDISGLAAGAHTLALYNVSGDVIGYGTFNIPAAGSGADALGETGVSENTETLLFSGLTFLLLGVVLFAVRKRPIRLAGSDASK